MMDCDVRKGVYQVMLSIGKPSPSVTPMEDHDDVRCSDGGQKKFGVPRLQGHPPIISSHSYSLYNLHGESPFSLSYKGIVKWNPYSAGLLHGNS